MMKDRLIFKRTPVSGDSCSKCGLKDLFNSAEGCNHSTVYGCDISYNFKLIEEEPVKVQPLSKYEWNQIRLENLEIYINSLDLEDSFPDADDKKLIGEVVHLQKWIKDNKPTNWQTCTKENTKVGDTILGKTSKEEYSVEYVYPYRDEMVLAQHSKNHDYTECSFPNYEIDLNNTEGK